MTSARQKIVEVGICRLTVATLAFGFGVVCSLARAAAPDGTWRFDRAADYYGRVPVGLVSRFDTIVVRNGEARFSADCAVRFSGEEYFFSDVFQSFTKADVTEKQVNVFLAKKLGVSLSGVKDVYLLVNGPATCARPVMEFFAIGDRLLIPSGGTFYSYVKQRTFDLKTVDAR